MSDKKTSRLRRARRAHETREEIVCRLLLEKNQGKPKEYIPISTINNEFINRFEAAINRFPYTLLNLSP